MCTGLSGYRFNGKACRKPGIHAAGHVIDMAVAQIGQRFRCNVAAMAGLAIDHKMVIQPGSDVPMPSLNFPEFDIQIGSWDESGRMFFCRANIDQDETLLWHRRRFGQTGAQLLDCEQVRVMGRHAADRDRTQQNQADNGDDRARTHGGDPFSKQVREFSVPDHCDRHDRDRTRIWSSLAFLFVIALGGCADGAKLIQEGEDGGVVVYPYNGELGSMVSSFRQDALSLMKEKCGGAYTIVREGEAQGRTRLASPVDGAQEILQERRWGMEFRCK